MQKPEVPQIAKTAEHEGDHIFAAGTAAVMLGIRQTTYENIIVHLEVRSFTGEVGLEFPAHVPDSMERDICGLMAAGPISQVAEAAVYIKNARFDDLAEAAELSPEDLSLLQQYSGPPLLPLRTAISVQLMKEDLGFFKLSKFHKTLVEISKNQLEPFPLSDFIPFKRARHYADRAEEHLKELIGEDDRNWRGTGA